MFEPRLLLAGVELANDADTSLLLHFNGNLTGAAGETPVQSTGTSFVPGLIGQAVRTANPGFVRYGTAGNIQPNVGTVELWVRSDVDAASGVASERFFHAGAGIANSIFMEIDGANNVVVLVWGDDPGTPAVETSAASSLGTSGAGWHAGEWHQVAATWDGAARELAFYVDGDLVGVRNNTVRIPAFSSPTLTVGASSDGNQPADSSFDEVRVSSRVRTADEVRASYLDGRGVVGLRGARGMDADANNRAIVAEAAAHRVTVFNANGAKAFSFGAAGTGSGQFRQPWDAAADASNNLLVADSGNHRVQRFDAGGNFLSSFGSAGTAAGQFNTPRGVTVDRASGKIYVADTLNHRVQRFLASGAIDTSWGTGGIAGTTAAVKRDHTGFDRPMDVAIHPVNGNVYVADFGNARLEVFDSGGAHVRTYLAVYRPNGLSFDAQGNLYIAGEDPNDSFVAYGGRLRLLRAGDELIGDHYTGGLDDIGRIEGGVAVRPDGNVVFTDNVNGRVIKTSASFAPPVADLTVDANGTSVTFRWKTAQPAASSVRYGSSAELLGSVATDPNVSTDHVVTVTGLTANSRLNYGVSFPDPFDGSERFTPTDVVNTGSPPGTTQFMRIKAAGVIYTDANPAAGVVTPRTDLAEARARWQRLADFYWRNSGFRLWLDITVIEVAIDLTAGSDIYGSLPADIAAAGFTAADDFDAAWGSSVLANGNTGGTNVMFGRVIGCCQFVTQTDFVAIHEVNHTLDSIYHILGLEKYEFNHGTWAIPGGVGHDLAVNGQILRNLLPANFTAARAPFTKVLTAPDADNDGVPDASPGGLTRSLSIAEATLGSSTSSADTDGDGLGDLAEAMALPFHNTRLTVADSDGDGRPDGTDRNPAYPMNDEVAKATPAVDGAIGPGEGWTVLTSNFGFSNDGLVADSNAAQGQTTTYAAWDDNFLYVALRGPAGRTRVSLDGEADDRFFGPGNYELTLENATFFREVKVNVGVPDVFRQIDDDGQFGEFFDTDPRFALPYGGGPIFNQPGTGLGFPGRLVTEGDLAYQRGGSGAASVWEVAIPFSNKTLLRGGVGREVAISYDVGGDLLFETDHAARIRLVAAAPPGGQQPFLGSPFQVTRAGPVTIQAEDFDRGGQGVAYHDTSPANTGGLYRPAEAVDIKTTPDAGGGFRLSDVAAGEYTEYSINVTQAGAFNLEFRVSNSLAGGRFHAEVDGVDVTGPLAVPNTGSFNANVSVLRNGVTLPAGPHVLRLAFDAAAPAPSSAVGGFNWVKVTPAQAPTTPTTVPISVVSYVRDGPHANTNFGTEAEFQVKRAPANSGTNRDGLLKLDLGGVPSIGSAKLRLNGRLSTSLAAGVQVAVFKSTNTSWQEGTVTWNTRPLPTGSALATFTVTGTTFRGYELDLTTFLRAEKAAGRSTATLVLQGVINTDPFVRFNSDTAAAGRPALVVTP